MDAPATGRPYTQVVTPRLVLMAAVLFAAVACGSESPPPARVPAGAIDGPWQAAPFALPGQLVEAVDRACRGGFDEFPQQTQLMVIDARGAGHAEAQYAAPNGDEASCIATIDAAGRVTWNGGGSGSLGKDWPVLKGFELEASGGYGSTGASTTAGRAGAGIARVVIVRPGQPPVTASLASGWYLAWVPGDWPPGTKVFGFDPLGQRVAEAPIQ